ncbi:MCE family protein [Nocardioides sp. NPDC051685]|uniref:MCE family protein n=1 Tax=Nocardioides sp. NPDC051685 TaxID=3364334 RepID=UPI0037A96303
MITRRTKIQLMVFLLITLLGVSFVGARYARLGSLFVKDHYVVMAHFEQSGGIYEDAEIDYRGVKIGQVGDLILNRSGVDVTLKIDNAWKNKIPADSLAVVGNRSAVGEQYVELQPQSQGGPYLEEGSEIARAATTTPLPTEKLLEDITTTVNSVDKQALTTTVDELGKGFAGTGRDLQTIIDTGTAFVETADQNFGLTTQLIRDSNTVLQGQLDSSSAIKSFATDLELFTGTLAGSNKDLIRLIESGSASSTELRQFLEQNQVDLGELLNEVLVTGKVVRKNLPGVKQVLSVFPLVVEGGFGVVDVGHPGLAQAHFGMVITTQPPCKQGYESTKKRSPLDLRDRPFNTEVTCTEPPSKSNARGSSQIPRAAVGDPGSVATFDPDTGKLTWADPENASVSTAAPASYGDDAWKWLYLQPMETE